MALAAKGHLLSGNPCTRRTVSNDTWQNSGSPRTVVQTSANERHYSAVNCST